MRACALRRRRRRRVPRLLPPPPPPPSSVSPSLPLSPCMRARASLCVRGVCVIFYLTTEGGTSPYGEGTRQAAVRRLSAPSLTLCLPQPASSSPATHGRPPRGPSPCVGLPSQFPGSSPLPLSTLCLPPPHLHPPSSSSPPLLSRRNRAWCAVARPCHDRLATTTAHHARSRRGRQWGCSTRGRDGVLVPAAAGRCVASCLVQARSDPAAPS